MFLVSFRLCPTHIFPFTDFALCLFAIINISPKYDYLLGPTSPPTMSHIITKSGVIFRTPNILVTVVGLSSVTLTHLNMAKTLFEKRMVEDDKPVILGIYGIICGIKK